MVWTDKLKLNKQLVKSITGEGLQQPAPIQLKTLARIGGGQDLIAAGPEGCGKTTTCILSALNKFRQGFDDAPRVLFLVPAKEQVLAVMEQFELLNKNKTIRVVALYAAPGMEEQLDALADGADIVVATPDRARVIYLKLALNLNRIQLMILDDADLIVKQGLQLPVAELANSITKCQHLVFTEVVHEKLMKMIDPFMQEPATITVEMNAVPALEAYEQVVYHVPNFRTKLNLLNLFLEDEELFTKVVIIVNTLPTADKLYQGFKRQVKKETMLFKQHNEDAKTVNDVKKFLAGEERILIALNSTLTLTDLEAIPFVLHFELPETKEAYVERITDNGTATIDDKLYICFATDLELTLVSKIETAIGIRIPIGDLPEELRIETNPVTRSKKAKGEEEQLTGAAFHEKKPANAKTYNYGSGVKARMTMKKKHG